MRRLLQRKWPFRFTPGLNEVYIAGSMALGNAGEHSDFDVIVVTEPGRLWTCRFFTLLIFTFLGWRTNIAGRRTRDGFCFNHFIAGQLRPFGDDQYSKKLWDNIRLIYRKDVQLHDREVGRIIEKILCWWQMRRIDKQIARFRNGGPERIIVNHQEVHLCFKLKTINL